MANEEQILKSGVQRWNHWSELCKLGNLPSVFPCLAVDNTSIITRTAMEHERETMTKAHQYADVQRHIVATLGKERHPITIMVVVTAILRQTFTHFYWVGFLLVEGHEMVVGPFQGPPACLRLPLDSGGVCGTCYRTAKTILVPDVAAFQGRVGCDFVSKSEIAVPIIVDRRVIAVLDIDSTELRAVDEVDQKELEQIALFVAARISSVPVVVD